MKTADVLNLDYRKQENKEIIQKVLKQIKPLSKFSDEEVIPLEYIEKAIKVMCRKYAVRMQYINVECSNSEDTYYSVSFREDISFEHIGVCYGLTIYELFAKASIKIFADVRSGKVQIREDK